MLWAYEQEDEFNRFRSFYF